MAIQEVRTFLEMHTFVLQRLKLPTGTAAITDVTNRVKQSINVAYRLFMRLEDWIFSHREGWLTTLDDYSTGTISVTKGNDSPVLSTAFGSNLEIGMRMKVGGDPTIYGIKTISGDPTIVFETVDRGATSTTATFKAWKDIYALASDFSEPVDFQEFFTDRSIRPISIREMRQMLTTNPSTGKPKFWTLSFRDATSTDADPKIQFYPPPNDRLILRYDYKPKVTLLATGIK